ncbi:Bacterial alpha-L-rhamnosidase [Planctomycetes bacterium MalM25]|nr:Bacterial alpha-L-rhamnosidase [Planctomycetes bacterium MalM25]
MSVLAIGPGRAVAEAPAPHRLTLSEGFNAPVGFYDPRPTFSWRLPVDDGIVKQSAYRIVVGKSATGLPEDADYWDSGKRLSDQSVYVPYGGKTLASRDVAHWRVKYWDSRGRESHWSDPARFELGLLDNRDWKAEWIHSEETQPLAKRIEVVRASYGVAGDRERQVDLTGKIRRLIDAWGRPVTASNDFAGSDPAPGFPKQLVITYRKGGESFTSTTREGSRLNLHTLIPSAYAPEYLRKEFMAPSPVVSARMYVTAKGLFEAYINGHRVGGDHLTPGWTPYHARVETLTYDVASLLAEGGNALGVVLGEGWYAGRMMRKRDVYPFVVPSALVQLEIQYADGSTQVVTTDSSWKASRQGPMRRSGIYDGEDYDARLEMPGWSRYGYKDSTWTGVTTHPVGDGPRLQPKRHHPIRATQEVKSVQVSSPSPGKHVFDLGQNLVGWPRVRLPVVEGALVTLRFAEMLNEDGTLYTENYRSAKSTDTYIPAATGVVEWQPTFTFHGFRYVEVSGVPKEAVPSTDWVTGVVLRSDFKQAGSFSSSNEKLNKLQSNITWGQRGNYLDIPTDCPQRDERLGWTGDAQVFCPTSIFNYDVHSFWASWLQSLREDQTPEGIVPNVVPNTLEPGGSPGWGDVAVVGPWEVYVRTGDRRLLHENYGMMAKWTAAYEREAKDFMVRRHGFGDWLQPYPETKNSRSDTPLDLIATAYFGRCAALMHKAALALDHVEDAAKYERLHREIRKAFSAEYFDSSGQMIADHETQTGYLLALAFDLLEPGLREPATVNLLQLIDDAGGHLRTGFLGTPLLAPQLDELGHSDKAYQVLLKETYPSWFYSINQGATTMWERWNSYSHEDGFGNAGMNSFNHYAYGAIGQWMYERIAGLAPDPNQPGYKHFLLQPNPGGGLTSASASLDTPYGEASCGWIRKGGKLFVKAVVPPNTTATFKPPHLADGTPSVHMEEGADLVTTDGGQTYLLKPGKYRMTVQ